MKNKFIQASTAIRITTAALKPMCRKNDLSLEQYQRLEGKRTMHSTQKNLY